MAPSKKEIDRLGDRLRRGSPSETDLQLLDEYRWSFVTVYERVIRLINEHLDLNLASRQTKTSQSIIEKLQRENTMHLSQIQDIAGCRIVVNDLIDQDNVVGRITELFADQGTVKAIDRRLKPSHGYRAVHLVIRLEGLPVEVQVRTKFQHRWAELSEKLAGTWHDQRIKYGGGPQPVRNMLARLSLLVEECEKHQRDIIREIQVVAEIIDAAPEDESTRQTALAFAEWAEETARRADQLRKQFDLQERQLRTNERPQ